MTGVSVVIPVFNGAKYLSECILSVLAQSHPAAEMIVVDDGSTDESASIAVRFAGSQRRPEPNSEAAQAPDVRVLNQPHRGPGAARNRGIEASTCDFLAFLDADDLWTPEKMERQMAAFGEDPELDLVSGLMQNFCSPELDAELRQRLAFAKEPVPAMLPSAIIVRRESFLRCGLFDEELQFGDFIPWWGRARDLGLKTCSLNEVVVFRRIHETNFNRTHPENRRDYLSAAKQVLERRRRKL
jgi:glycosyltransferase involved in cell wall biosynthesis